MSTLSDILENQINPTKEPRKRKPKNYGDLVWNSQANIGDVVYMASNPDVKMTVAQLPRINRTAHSVNNRYEVTVQWLDTNNHMTNAVVDADTLLKD